MDEPNPSETQNTTSLSRSRGGFKPAPTRLNIFSLVRNIFASAQNIIGIDIGSHSIKLLQLQKSAKGYAITNHITRTITQAVKDKPQEKKRIVKEFVKGIYRRGPHQNHPGQGCRLGKRRIYLFA